MSPVVSSRTRGLTDATEMDSIFLVVALMGFFFFSAVVADATSAYADVVEAVSSLAAERSSVIDGLLLVGSAFLLASVLARLFAFARSRLAAAVSLVLLALESLACAARWCLDAIGSTALASILAWMLRRLVWPLLLLVLRPFLPGILRNYHLWKNWLECRAGDFVDAVCIDRERQAERRRHLRWREQVYCARTADLARLNDAVARVARKAAEVFSEHRFYLEGKYEHLRPTPFAGRIAAAVPEEGPVPRLGLWFRLRHRIDWDVFWADQKILRVDAALAKIQEGIADLDHQLKFRSQELRAIEDQARICKLRAKEAWQRELRARSRPQPRPARQTERGTRTGDSAVEPESLFERINAANMRGRVTVRSREATTTSTTITTAPTTALVHAPTANAVDSPADVAASPDSAKPLLALPAPPSRPSLPPPPTRHLLPPPPPPPTADEILAAAAATPLPVSAEEAAVESAIESMERARV